MEKTKKLNDFKVVDVEKEPQNSYKHKEQRYYLIAVKKMRVILMACAILYTFSPLSIFGDISSALFSFAFPALYIISGFLVLRRSKNIEKRILNTIKRTVICFVILFAAYLILSFFIDSQTTLEMLKSKSFWIDFLVLNICKLPAGSTIWFVQALLYAYIIIYLIYKCKLLKFDIYIAGLCLVVTLLTGEFSSVIGFNFLGHEYLGGNFLTRALPYILIGCFIYRKERIFGNISLRKHIVIAVIGVVLSVAEYVVLDLTGKKAYVGHLLGMGLVAVAISLFCFLVDGMEMRSIPLKYLSRNELMIPFFVCSPIYDLLILLCRSSQSIANYLGNYIGIVTLVISFLVLYLYSYLRLFLSRTKLFKKIKNRKMQEAKK